MSRKATALDNAVIESFFNKLKVEIGSLKQFENADQLMETIKSWLNYYNTERIQTKLKGWSPVEYRQLAS